jgi:hypothetical protein
MTATLIFGLQVVTNLALFSLVARWYIVPWLRARPLTEALTPLLLFHMLRTIGVAFVLPQVVGQPLPAAFAVPGALGDLLAVALALVAIVALRRGWPGALALAWLFNIAGTLDFVVAFTQGLRFDIAQQYQLGPAWFIPTFFVPAFFVTHLLIFALLFAHARQRQPLPGRIVARPQAEG